MGLKTITPRSKPGAQKPRRDLVEALLSPKIKGEFEGLTLKELVKESGESMDTVRKKLQLLHEAGLLQPGSKTITAIDGRSCRVPAYKLKSRR